MNNFEVVAYNSMDTLLKGKKDTFMVYGDSDEDSNRFEHIRMCKNNFECGLVYYYSGLKPEILIIDVYNLIIGFDKFLVFIDYYTNKTILKIRLKSLFYEFIQVKYHSLTIAICELDVVVINNNGENIWSMGFKDIIEQYSIEDEKELFIKCFNGEDFNFNIFTGELLK